MFRRILAVLAIVPLAAPLAVAAPEAQLIPVPFTLKEPGFVTLVIEDQNGKRVRNLISETEFPAGQNTAWWDGLDDLGRDLAAAKHAIYHIPGKLVPPGQYRVRGLVRPKLGLTYEFTPYTNGNPPWRTADTGSQWLANHTAPGAVLFVPAGVAPTRAGKPTSAGGQVLVGSHVSEGGSGLAWLDMDGRKLNGQMWLGGIWTGASFLARDEGDHPVPNVYAYAGAGWKGDKYNNNVAELRLHELVAPGAKTAAPKDVRLGSGEDRPVLTPTFKIPGMAKAADNLSVSSEATDPLGGLAVRNGLLVAAVPSANLLLFVDAAAHKELGTATLECPRGLAFDRQGRLLVLSGSQLLRYTLGANPVQLAKPETVLSDLDEPRQLTLDKAGNIYVSQWGNSHQVRIYTPAGKAIRAIGLGGKPRIGDYDPRGMHFPNGITLDGQNRLWVAETDKAPKRVSVWSQDGQFLTAYYGPAAYGGGGWIDPTDKSRFFYTDEGGGLQLKLDWATGKSEVTDVYAREDNPSPITGYRVGYTPQTPLAFGGRTYLTNAFSSNPTEGAISAGLWLLEKGVAHSVATFGGVRDARGELLAVFQTPAFKDSFPALKNGENALFVWSDKNRDGQVQPDEASFLKPARETVKGATVVDGVTVQPDLSFNVAIVGDQALRFKPQSFTPGGVPVYDLGRPEVIVNGVQRKASSGGGQALVADDGWAVLTTAPAPFAAQGVAGVKNGQPMWSYPSLWPGLHASHNAAPHDRPGMLLGTTRLLGNFINPPGSEAGNIWAINGNMGNIYLLSSDGLFIATLFQDGREASWNLPVAQRGMPVDQVSLTAEQFWPSITQTPEGQIYLQARGSIIHLTGLEGIRRIPASDLNITAPMLVAAQNYSEQEEAKRQQAKPQGKLVVALQDTPPVVDGKLDDWKADSFVTLETRTLTVGNWGHRPSQTVAAITISGDRLYAALRCDDPNLLQNSGESLINLFKTGGALDLMLDAIPGGERLLISQVKGKTTAMLYRPQVPGTTTDPVQFASPVSTVKFDRVDVVSDQVTLAATSGKDPKGEIPVATFEISVPLSVLGLKPAAGQTMKGDIGILRGNGFETMQRVYWNNKATGQVSDVPSEAMLTPRLWGTWEFVGTG